MSRNTSQVLLLDTNIFIEAQKRYYAQDICPGFWDCLLHHCNEGTLRSIDRVREEIRKKMDRLWIWAREAPSDLFVSSSEQSVQEAFFEIMNWVEQQEFKNEAKVDFAQGADGWLVAYAKVHSMMLITDEVKDLRIRKKVPIPNVCEQFNIQCKGTFEMLRTLEVQFSEWHSPFR